MKVTAWSIINDKTGKVSFNHIENGWSEYDKPEPIEKEFTNQLAWQNSEWNKKHAYLIDGVVQYK